MMFGRNGLETGGAVWKFDLIEFFKISNYCFYLLYISKAPGPNPLGF